MYKSMSLEYEPSSEPLHISAEQLFLNCRYAGTPLEALVAATTTLVLNIPRDMDDEAWESFFPPGSYRRDPTPYTLHPTPYTLHPTPCTLHPTPYTLHPTPCTLHPTPYTLHPTPYTLHPTPESLLPTPLTLHPRH